MKWVIQCISDKTLYWNNNEGWVTTNIIEPDDLEDYAEVYTDTEKEINVLPIDGKWIHYKEIKR
tara:strand:+ start:4031 stop:4222 length:192 start_codon:yes stop_codon:yes gene_type:complete